MQRLKTTLFAIALTLLGGNYSALAQVYVHIRPHRPHYVRVAPPTPHHVWIDEDWEPRGGSYVFIGGHWAQPPRPRAMWVPGHWRHRPHGWVWIPGHWR